MMMIIISYHRTMSMNFSDDGDKIFHSFSYQICTIIGRNEKLWKQANPIFQLRLCSAVIWYFIFSSQIKNKWMSKWVFIGDWKTWKWALHRISGFIHLVFGFECVCQVSRKKERKQDPFFLNCLPGYFTLLSRKNSTKFWRSKMSKQVAQWFIFFFCNFVLIFFLKEKVIITIIMTQWMIISCHHGSFMSCK